MVFDRERFDQDGFAITREVLSSTEIGKLIAAIEEDIDSPGMRGGVRDVMNRVPVLYSVARNSVVRSIVDEVLGKDAFVVRSTLFDKTAGANWKVPWHQDVTIGVRERIDTEGYGPWSVKQGIPHVQPPTEVLNGMMTVRVHLDPCPANNGALRVIPGSHRLGRINQNDAPEFANEKDAICCEAAAGEALIMRPLVLHASSAAEVAGHRRVLHFDFANLELANGLRWQLR